MTETNSDFEAIGRSLQREREKQGITKAKLSQDTGLSETTIRSIESGDLGQAKRLKRVLDRLGKRLKIVKA